MDWHRGIRAAYPNALLTIQGDTFDDLVVTNQETNEPFVFDQALAEAAWNKIAAEAAATQYQRNRQPEYPSLATLADALYWSNQGDNTKLDEYYAACAAVKAKYPKPEVN
jgi:hypothetical protein